ncbi:MAG: SIS domain-containing protein [Bacillota bacterium]
MDEVTAIDPRMSSYLEKVKDLVKQGYYAGQMLGLPECDSVFINGVGGSAAAGRFALEATPGALKVPCEIGTWPVPRWVGERTVAISISYSGSTWETLAAHRQILDRGARVFSICSGGEMANVPSSSTILVPGGLLPRIATYHMGFAVLAMFLASGLAEPGCDVEECVLMAETLHARWQCDDALPHELASKLKGRRVHVIGVYGLTETAAYRWKCEICENAKIPAVSSTLPEALHNEAAALGVSAGQESVFVALRHPQESFPLNQVINDYLQVLGSRSAVLELSPEGISPVAQALYLHLLGSYVSLHLASAVGADPVEIAVIENLKKRMRSDGGWMR